jgi:hypothetical protein
LRRTPGKISYGSWPFQVPNGESAIATGRSARGRRRPR